MDAIAERASAAERRPSVACIEWLEPLMSAGNWIPELVNAAGGRNLFGEAGKHSPWMKWEELILADPDVIIALPCGFDLQKTRDEMHWLTARPGVADLRAVCSGQTYVCDGNQFMNRPGPRVVESLRIFAEIIHPELFPPMLVHSGWERF
jgi:iron complex transport system substrate-binding protein